MNTLLSSLNGGLSSNAGDILTIVFLLIFTIVVSLAGVYVIATNINRQDKDQLPADLAKPKKESQFKVVHAVFLVLALGFAIRTVFALTTNGFLGTNPQNLTASNNRNGLVLLYQTMGRLFTGQGISQTSYGVHLFPEGIYPVPFLFFTMFGGIAHLFSPINSADPSIAAQLLFRMPFILFDIGTALLLFFAAKKFLNQRVGLGLVIIYALNPIFIFASSIWGSMFSILAFFIVLSLYFMASKNFLGLTIAFSLALLTSSDAILFSPVFIVFVGYHCVKAIKIVKAERQRERDLKLVRGRKAYKPGVEEDEALNKKKKWYTLMMDKERGLAIRIPLYIVASLIVMYVLSLPLLAHINFNPWSWFVGLFFTPFASGMRYVTFNGMTIYTLFGRNGRPVAGDIPAYVYSILFFVVAIALVLTIYISKKNRANMVLVASYLVFTLSIFFMNFSELNLITVLAGLLISFIFIKDKRILHVFSLLSITVLINAGLVMMTTGYFANIPLSYYDNSNATAIIDANAPTAAVAMNLVMTALTLIIFVYKSFILLDITLANTRKPFTTRDRAVLPVLYDFMRIRKR